MENKNDTSYFGINNELAERLDLYIKSNLSKFAFLITGEWGSGKTYFIKNYIKQKENLQDSNKDEKQVFCYISLYGISSYNEINQAIYAEINPLFFSEKSNKFAKVIASAITPLAMGINLSEIAKGIKDIIAQIPNNLIVVLDDIERSTLCIGDILGYCNKLLVQGDVKVILLANEENMSNPEIYTTNKEKIIGFSMKNLPDPENLYNTCLLEIRNENSRRVLEKNKTTILDTYKIYGFTNLRTLEQFFWEVEILLENLNKKVLEHREIKIIILKLFILSYLLKNKKIVLSDMYQLLDITKLYCSEELQQYKDILTNLNCLDDFYSSMLWRRYFEKANDYKGLCLGYERKLLASSTPHSLWTFYDMTSVDFYKYLKRMQLDLTQRKYISVTDFMHANGILLRLSSEKIIKRTHTRIVKDALKYIKSDVIQLSGVIDKERFYSGDGQLGYHSFESDSFKTIASALYDLYISKMKINEKSLLKKYLQKLKRGDFNIEEFDELALADKLVFYDINYKVFAQLIIQHELYDIYPRLMNAELLRTNKGKEYYKWLKLVGSEFKRKIPKDSFKKMRINKLIRYIDHGFEEYMQQKHSLFFE